MKNLNKTIIKNIRLFNMLRILISCVIAYTIAMFFHIPYIAWAPITIIVVMAANYSGAISHKASQRISGTFLGALLGLSLYLLPETDKILHYTLLLSMLAVTLFFTLGKYSYGAILASVTLVLVAGNGPGDLTIALWRTVNVLWGGLLAILASKFLFPARASYHFKVLSGDYLEQFHLVYSQHNQLAHQQEEHEPINLAPLNATLKQLSGLEGSIKHETPNQGNCTKKLIQCYERMFSLLENITQTPWSHQYGHRKIQELDGLFEAKEQLSNCIATLAEHISSEAALPYVLQQKDLEILSLYPTIAGSKEPRTDISFYSYLWLNRELARKLIGVTEYIEAESKLSK